MTMASPLPLFYSNDQKPFRLTGLLRPVGFYDDDSLDVHWKLRWAHLTSYRKAFSRVDISYSILLYKSLR